MRAGGNTHSHNIGRLVLLAFVGPPPPSHECCHGPAGKLNDRLPNLSWGTKSKNKGEDQRRDGTLVEGEKQWNSKLTTKDIVTIRKLEGVLGGFKVASLYGVSYPHIWLIWKRKAWKHVP